MQVASFDKLIVQQSCMQAAQKQSAASAACADGPSLLCVAVNRIVAGNPDVHAESNIRMDHERLTSDANTILE